jgi:hypothetical protein
VLGIPDITNHVFESAVADIYAFALKRLLNLIIKIYQKKLKKKLHEILIIL